MRTFTKVITVHMAGIIFCSFLHLLCISWLLLLYFSAKCLQRQLSCILGLNGLFSSLGPQGQTLFISCQESKLPPSISLTSFQSHFTTDVLMAVHYQAALLCCLLSSIFMQ